MFVGVERASFLPPAPRFDVLDFQDDQLLHLRSTIHNDDFLATYTLQGKELAYQFQPLDIPRSVNDRVEYRFLPYKSGIILTDGDTELMYYRPWQILPNDIAGVYKAEGDATTEILYLHDDGSFRMENSKVFGQYRLWRHFPQGRLMTMMTFLPEEGWASFTYRLRKSRVGFAQSPLVGGKILKEGTMTWRLLKQGTAPR